MSKEKLMSFLYGEMNDEEANEFKKKLNEDKGLRQELESLQGVRQLLQSAKDVSPEIKTINFPTKQRFIIPGKWWAIAASIAAFMILGNVLDLKITLDSNQFSIHYGEKNNPNDGMIDPNKDMMSKEEFIALLDQSNARLQDDFQQQLVEHKNNFQDANDYKQDFAQFRNELNRDQKRASKLLVEEFKKDQNGRTDLLIDNLLEYVDVRRQDDMETINSGLNNLAQMIQVSNEQLPQYVYQPIEK